MSSLSHDRRLACALAVVAAILSALLPASPAQAADAQLLATARPSAAFLDSVGVNIHTAYNDTSYGDADRLLRLVTELGVKHVRDGLKADRPDTYELLRRLAARGVRSSLVLGDPRSRWGSPNATQAVELLRGPLAGTFDLVEGANEFDCSGRPDWAEATRQHQAQLADLLARDPALRDVPLLSPSFCNLGQRARYGLEPNADAGNMHPYPGGQVPEHRIQDEVRMLASLTGDKPQYATETGYHNALVGVDGHPGVDEDTAATYLLRMYLENFRVGIVRTYAYELLDQRPEPARQDMEQHFGLVRADGSPKPAYVALRNLLSVLRDDATAAPQGPENPVRLEGAPDTARSVVLRRKDGSTDVVLWNAVPVSARPVPVRLVPGIPSSASTASPVDGTGLRPVVAGEALTIALSPAPQVVRLTSLPVAPLPAPVVVPPVPSAGPPASGPAPAATSPAPPAPTIGPVLRSWWRLAERRGVLAADASGSGSTGRYAGAQLAVPGPSGDGAVRLRGTSGVVGRVRGAAPSAFSVSFAFRTSSTPGGRLVGFGDASGGASTTADRHVYLTDDGRLVLGVLGAGRDPLVVVAPGRWDDGRWHHVTATLGGGRLALYVDGVLRATRDSVVAGVAYTGTWRVGADSLSGWPLQPGRGMVVDVDEVRTYEGALSEVAARRARAT